MSPIETLNVVEQNTIARIATCSIYVNVRAIESHKCVVVSHRWNGRGVYRHANGSWAVGPYPQQMPTCFTKCDAEALVQDLNEQLAGRETLKVVSSYAWWCEELATAERVLAEVRSSKALAAL